MEEVGKQVKAALDERESEMRKLQDENQELRQAVHVMNQRNQAGGPAGTPGRRALGDGGLGLQGMEPRGNPESESHGVFEPGGPPPGLSAQSQVPGGSDQGSRPRYPVGLSAQFSLPGGRLQAAEIAGAPSGYREFEHEGGPV